ncbi:MAG TPA: amidohydrolase family protein [Capsulimonadaceae bacterium]|nr:amidohydrolase family protein [Capsulimonadaceae bacterium]
MDIIDINTFFGAFPSQHAGSTPESLVAQLDKFGVRQAFTLSTLGMFYNDEAGNAHTQEVAAASDRRLLPVATINPGTHLSDMKEVVEQVAGGPFAFCRFFPPLQDWPIDYAPFAQALKRLAELKKPVMVSIGKAGDITALSRILPDSTNPVILTRVHAQTLAEAVAVMREHPGVCLETHSMLIPDGLARIKDLVGADRLVFGSGGAAHSLGAALMYVQKSSLSDQEKAAVLGGNALRLLGKQGGGQ